mgnify:CR=1 FL=1
MRKSLLLILIIAQAAFSALDAQSFSQKLTTPTKGTVTLHQDQRLTSIIDGTNTSSLSFDETTLTDKTGKKTKVRGFRIQVYFGASSKADQTKAQRIGSSINHSFNELDYYVSYKSPHWRCRVGDFATRDEAKEYLDKIKEAGYGKDAMVVESEIFIYLPN